MTLKANPALAQALNGELAMPLDVKTIRVVSPEKVEKFGGSSFTAASADIEAARHAARAQQRRVAQSTAAVVETNRGITNAFRGSRFDQSKG